MATKLKLGGLALAALLAYGGVSRADMITFSILADQSKSTGITTGTSSGDVDFGGTPNASGAVTVYAGALGTIALDVYASLGTSTGAPAVDGLLNYFGGFYQQQTGGGVSTSGAFSTGSIPSLWQYNGLYSGGTVGSGGNIYGTSSSSTSSGWWGGTAQKDTTDTPSITYGWSSTGSGANSVKGSGAAGIFLGTVYYTLGGDSSPAGTTNLWFYPMSSGLGNPTLATSVAGGTGTVLNLNTASWKDAGTAASGTGSYAGDVGVTSGGSTKYLVVGR